MSIARQSTELRLAVFRLARRLRLEHADEALSDAQFGALAVVNRFGPLGMTELAQRERVTVPSMNRTVGVLLERGYVTREADASDGRRAIIVVTAAGAAVVQSTLAQRDAWLTNRMRTLRPEERAALAEAGRIIDRLASEE